MSKRCVMGLIVLRAVPVIALTIRMSSPRMLVAKTSVLIRFHHRQAAGGEAVQGGHVNSEGAPPEM